MANDKNKTLEILKEIGIENLEDAQSFLEANKHVYGDWNETIKQKIELITNDLNNKKTS